MALINDLNDFGANAHAIKDALLEKFPGSYVVTMPGYMGRVRVKIVGTIFEGLEEQARQEIVWNFLRGHFQDGAQAVSYVVVYSDDEL